jgi:ribosomal protein S15P/S13E
MRTLQVTLRHSIAMAQRAQMVAMQISLQEDRIERLTRHIAARRKDLSSSMEISELQLDIENLENLLKEAVETQERIRLTARLELERKRKQLRDDITAQIEADIQRLENKRQQEQDRLSDLQRDAIAIQREVNDYLRETQRKP